MTNRITRGKAAFGAINVPAGGLSIAGTSTAVTAADLTVLHAVTASAAEINKLHSTGAGAPLRTEIINFTEVTGSGSIAGTVTIPAGGFVHDVILHTSVQWTAATSAAMSVGDADAATGYINAVNLKTQTADTTGMGGISNFKGDTGAGANTGKTKYYATAGLITATATKVGSGTAGRSSVTVIYSVPTAQAAA